MRGEGGTAGVAGVAQEGDESKASTGHGKRKPLAADSMTTPVGVIGEAYGCVGFLAGHDPVFQRPVGVYGESANNGVYGRTASPVPEDNAVFGQNDGAGHGVAGISNKGIGVVGESAEGVGIEGRSYSATNGLAGKFIGNVHVYGNEGTSSGDLTVEGNITAFDVKLSGGDCAEDFDIAGSDSVEPGTVMVVDQEGVLCPCDGAYDKKVAGVISGAGDYTPGIVLGKVQSLHNRQPLALVGKVYCKADAQCAPIAVGDLLTTSSTRGHAMKAVDPLTAFRRDWESLAAFTRGSGPDSNSCRTAIVVCAQVDNCCLGSSDLSEGTLWPFKTMFLLFW